MITDIPVWKQRSTEGMNDVRDGAAGFASFHYHDDEIFFDLEELTEEGNEDILKELLAQRYESGVGGLNFLRRHIKVLAYERVQGHEHDGSFIACYRIIYSDIGPL